ncbi:MAG TPA: transposase, partial [Planctomycetota bacterium]
MEGSQMQKKRDTEEQIVRILGKAEAGVKIEELTRKYGVSRNTIYRWRAKYGGLEISDLRRLKELAAERPRFGYRRLHVLLVREGWQIHRKRVLRIYQELGLQVRRKKRKQVSRASRRPKEVPTLRSESWSMDAGVSLAAPRMIRALERAIEERGQPRRLTMDNGPEFTSRALDAWAYQRGIELHFIRP